MRNQQGEKKVSSMGQLVFRPGTGLLTLLGLISVCPVKPVSGGDRGWRPLMAVRGIWGSGTARGGGIGCRDELLVWRGLGLGGSRFGWTECKNWRCRIASKKV